MIAASWYGEILGVHDTEPTELFGGLLKILLGALLLLPLDTFGGASVYGLLGVLPEPLWGLLLLVLGTAHVAALHNGHRQWRRAMALAGFVVWFSWSVSFWEGSPSNTGGCAYLLFALMQGWAYARLGMPR